MEALIKLIAVQDEAALKELYRLMQHRIVAFAMQRLDNAELAEEVMVETLFEVWNHASRYAGHSKASTWILGIARHKALDKVRGRNNLMEPLLDAHLEIASDEMSQLERVDAQQQDAALQGCIKQLSIVQRECVHFAFYQDLSMEDIARLQACPVNTVKTRLFHARKNLTDCMTARGHGSQS
jgi:RNA polymerase sigma-70 factor, ECF subfamily